MSPEDLIRSIAAHQHGHVAWWQIRGEVSRSALRHMVAKGRLHRSHVGVYTIDRVVTKRGRIMAAVLAAGPAAVASHRAAAFLRGLSRRCPLVVDVTVLTGTGTGTGSGSGSGGGEGGGGARSRKRVNVHRCALDVAEVETIDGIRVTTVARTLIDLAETVRPLELHKFLDQAFDHRLFDKSAIDEAVARRPRRRGSRTLTRALEDHIYGAYRGENPFEDLLVPLLEAHSIHLPKTQVHMVLSDGTAIRPDAVWHTERVVVELDGGTHFNARRAREDRRRDALLSAAGWHVLRFTWSQLTREAATVAAAIRVALSAP